MNTIPQNTICLSKVNPALVACVWNLDSFIPDSQTVNCIIEKENGGSLNDKSIEESYGIHCNLKIRVRIE